MRTGRLFRLTAVLLLLMASIIAPASPAQATNTCPCTVFANNTPTLTDAGPDDGRILGMTFHSEIDGYVTGVRFYKSAANSGVHVGTLWRSVVGESPIIMAEVTFTGESTSGWQTAQFANPIRVYANSSYMIAYSAENGHYAADHFDTFPTIGPIHVDAPGSKFGDIGDPPTLTYNNTNYWVDVTFATDAGVTSLFNMTADVPVNPVNNDGREFEFGVRFSSDVGTTVRGIRYWASATGFYWRTPVSLWKSDGTLLATATYPDYGWPPVGWREVFFDTPIPINAGQEYVASYYADSYAITPGVFDQPYSNGHFHTPANASVLRADAGSGFPDKPRDDGVSHSIDPMFDVGYYSGVTVTASVEPALSFTVDAWVGNCNGVTQSAGVSSSSSAITFGSVGSSGAVVAQKVRVATNAANGYTVTQRYSGPLTNVNGASIADLASRTNGAPGAFAAAGTAAFGYTTDDTALSSGGNGSLRFFSSGVAQWAALATADSEISHSSIGPVDKTSCVAYRVATAATSAAGVYLTSVVYTAIPSF